MRVRPLDDPWAYCQVTMSGVCLSKACEPAQVLCLSAYVITGTICSSPVFSSTVKRPAKKCDFTGAMSSSCASQAEDAAQRERQGEDQSQQHMGAASVHHQPVVSIPAPRAPGRASVRQALGEDGALLREDLGRRVHACIVSISAVCTPLPS